MLCDSRDKLHYTLPLIVLFFVFCFFCFILLPVQLLDERTRQLASVRAESSAEVTQLVNAHGAEVNRLKEESRKVTLLILSDAMQQI